MTTKRAHAGTGLVRRCSRRCSGRQRSRGAIQTVRMGTGRLRKSGMNGSPNHSRERGHHQQQMLHHVDLQQIQGKGIDWRCQGEKDGEQACKEALGCAAASAAGHAAAAAASHAGRGRPSGATSPSARDRTARIAAQRRAWDS